MAKRTPLRTTLTSAQLRMISPQLRERALFSAQVSNAELLESLALGLEEILSGDMSQPQMRLALKDIVDEFDLRNLASDHRLNLIIETNVNSARSFANFVKGHDRELIDVFPAWELTRFEPRQEPRDWPERWQTAATVDRQALEVFFRTGRMVAKKTSLVWERLGSPFLFDDALGNPYPPFAFNSGMDVFEVDREEAIQIGIIKSDEIQMGETTFAFNESLEMSPQLSESAFREALLEDLGGKAKFQKGVLVWQ